LSEAKQFSQYRQADSSAKVIAIEVDAQQLGVFLMEARNQ